MERLKDFERQSKIDVCTHKQHIIVSIYGNTKYNNHVTKINITGSTITILGPFITPCTELNIHNRVIIKSVVISLVNNYYSNMTNI